MNDAKMNVVRFDAADIISTSCLPMNGMSKEAYRLTESDPHPALGTTYSYVTGDGTGLSIYGVNFGGLYDSDGTLIVDTFDGVSGYVGQYFHYERYKDKTDKFRFQVCVDDAHHK